MLSCSFCWLFTVLPFVMPRNFDGECQVCGRDDTEINTRGKCEHCSRIGRVAAASVAGSSGTGSVKVRAATRKRKPWSVKKRTGKNAWRGRARKELFIDMIKVGLNPKAFSRNIPEFSALQTFCQRSAQSSLKNFSATFLLGRGIRGAAGINVANSFFKKRNNQITEANLILFVKHFEQEHKKAGGGSALSHQEQRHHFFSGNRFVSLLASSDGRAHFFQKARLLEQHWYGVKNGTADYFPVLAFKDDLQGFRLSVVNGYVQTAQRYNAMEYARSASLIAHAVFGVETQYTKKIHKQYLKDQSGGDASYALTSRKGSVTNVLQQVQDKDLTWKYAKQNFDTQISPAGIFVLHLEVSFCVSRLPAFFSCSFSA